MKVAINQFQNSIDRVRHLDGIYTSLQTTTTPALDISDILRAEFVLIVSAFDYYIHEITRIGMLEIYKGSRAKTNSFLKFQISMDNTLQGISNPDDIGWLNNQIRSRHSYQTFQHPDKIAEAVRLISDVKLWDEVSKQIGYTSKEIKIKLKLIVRRRNQIAHEADINPDYGQFYILWPIDSADVNDTIDFIEQIAKAIHQILDIDKIDVQEDKNLSIQLA